MKKPLIEKNILVHFGESDPQGILYHSRVYEIAHTLLEEFWSAHTLGWKFWFQNAEWAVPLRHSECDYLAPMRVGESFTAALHVAEVGDSSIAFACEISNSGKLCARVKTVHVFVDRKSFKKTSVPAEILQVFKS